MSLRSLQQPTKLPLRASLTTYKRIHKLCIRLYVVSEARSGSLVLVTLIIKVTGYSCARRSLGTKTIRARRNSLEDCPYTSGSDTHPTAAPYTARLFGEALA